MSKTKSIILGIIGCLLTFGIFIVTYAFPMIRIGHYYEGVAHLENAVTPSIRFSAIFIILSYIVASVMLFCKNPKSYIAQSVSILAAIVMELSFFSLVSDGLFKASIAFGFWILILVSIAWTYCLYLAGRQKPTKEEEPTEE